MGWLLEPELPLRVAYLRITELTWRDALPFHVRYARCLTWLAKIDVPLSLSFRNSRSYIEEAPFPLRLWKLLSSSYHLLPRLCKRKKQQYEYFPGGTNKRTLSAATSKETQTSTSLAIWSRGTSTGDSLSKSELVHSDLSLTGIEPVSSAWKAGVLTTGRKGQKSHSFFQLEVVLFFCFVYLRNSTWFHLCLCCRKKSFSSFFFSLVTVHQNNCPRLVL